VKIRARFDPFSFLVISIAGWMNRYQQHVIEYLFEKITSFENRLGIGGCDSTIASVAAMAKKLSPKILEALTRLRFADRPYSRLEVITNMIPPASSASLQS
jgi:hypothetical protein